jgi:two-component system NtrC family sensor kinase
MGWRHCPVARMRSPSLRFKVGASLAITVMVGMLVFTLLVMRQQRSELFDSAAANVLQLSEVIARSTRFAMLQNQPTYVDRIIQDVASQGRIDKVRILSGDGRIIHSTHPPEIGTSVDRNAEACVNCHRGDQPLRQLPRSERTWTFTAPDGRRMLGSMEVIRNEPSCYTAACHQHSSETSVLGVLDIVYSLDEVVQMQRFHVMVVGGLSILFALGVGLIASLLVRRLISAPLNDLGAGAKRLASGDLEHAIPVRSADELGQLAGSFNAMTTALKKSEQQLREWAHTLEEKVEARTRELRIAQAETLRGEKLASVGLLAAGIAHELNNPLTGVLTFSHLVREKMPEGSPEAEDMDLVIRETRRCASIIRRLLDFAREKAPEQKYVDLNQVIEDTVSIVDVQARVRDIEIRLDLDRELPKVWADADLVKQVVMNMLVNAQQAIEGRGNITVRSRRCKEARSAEPGRAAVPMVELAITDTGCGIPEKDLQRIFDPFFTSKEVGKGTGLGLSVSHGIVAAHGGSIDVQSKVGEGSTFRVYLPIDPSAAEAAQQPEGAMQ